MTPAPPAAIPLLDTPRLRLRPFVPTDAPAVSRLAGAPEVAAMMVSIPHPFPDGLAERWIGSHAAAAAERRVLIWAIAGRAGPDADALLGSIDLGLTPEHARGNLSYWLGVPYWGRGYMTEAVRRVVAFGFAELGLHRIQAMVFPRNATSRRVLEKAGMVREGVLRDYVRKGDAFEDVAVYAALQPRSTGARPRETRP